MKTFKKRKNWIFTLFIVTIFSLHILNLNNLKLTNSIQLNGNDSSGMIIKNSQAVDILTDKKGNFFILSTDNNSTKISFLNRNFIGSNQDVISTQLSLKYLDAKIVNDDVYLLVINDENQRQIIKVPFSNGNFSAEPNICFQFLEESLVNSFYIADDTLFFVENGTLWGFMNSKSSAAVELSSDVNSIFLDFSTNYLYIVKEDKSVSVFFIDDLKKSIDENSSPNFINLTLNDEVDLRNNPVNFLNDNLFMSSTGRLFKINTSQNIPTEIEEIFTLDVSEISVFNCSTIFNFESESYLLFKIDKNKVGLFDMANNLIRKYNIELADNLNIFNICSSAEDTLLAYKDSDNNYYAKLIGEDDLKEENLTEELDSLPDDEENPQESPNSAENNNNLLGEYKTDAKNKYILGVELGTTVATFKQNLNLNGEYTVTFKNYAGKDITSGKLGTGSVVSFWKDNKLFKEYTLVVNYDITGEGNFNSRDFDYMYNHIFQNEKTTLSGEYFLSGDMDNDGKIDTLDLLKMKKALES